MKKILLLVISFIIFSCPGFADSMEKVRKDFSLRLTNGLRMRVPENHGGVLMSESGAIKKVMKEFSNLEYISDGETDYWKSYEETINDGGGDCEDLAIFLTHRLIDLGFPKENIAVLVCQFQDGGSHIETVIFHKRKWMVFTNLGLESLKFFLLETGPFNFLCFQKLDSSEQVYSEDIISLTKNLPNK